MEQMLQRYLTVFLKLSLFALVFGMVLKPISLLANPIQLKLVFLGNTDDEDYDGSLVFKHYVEAHSQGQIKVVIFPGGQLCGNASECIQGVQAGVIEIFMTTLGGFSHFFPEIQVLDLPYLFSNDAIVEEVYSGPFVSELRTAIIQRTGLRLMTMTNTGGWRNFATTNRAIRSPGDLKGLKIRTINSEIHVRFVKLLQASPTPIAWPELYTSLATGVVQGSKNGITDIVGMKFHEHVKHLLFDKHTYMSALWLMNQSRFIKLSGSHRKIINDGFAALRSVTTALPKRRRIDAIQEFRKAGGAIYIPSPEEKQQFVAAAKPLREWYQKKYGQKWLLSLDKAIAMAEKKRESLN